MDSTETTYEHVVLTDRGVPIIEGTTMKVIELALDVVTYGWSPEEAQFQHPYLSLGQVYSALAYYWDHRDELEGDIARRLERVDDLQRTAPATMLRARLRQPGRVS